MAKATSPSTDVEYMDFDAALNEEKQRVIKFKIGGKEYELPGVLPAEVPLVRLAEARQSQRNVVASWLQALLGEEALNEILATGASQDLLGDVVKWVLSQYGFQFGGDGADDGEDDEEGGQGKEASTPE